MNRDERSQKSGSTELDRESISENKFSSIVQNEIQTFNNILSNASLCFAYANAINQVDSMSMTPLHCACSTSQPSENLVKILLCHRVTDLLVQDVDGDTPLHAACRVGANTSLLEVLVNACPHALFKRDKEKLTPSDRLWMRFVVLRRESKKLEHVPMGFVEREFIYAWETLVIFMRAIARLGNELEFNLVQTLILNDCPQELLDIALTLHPEQALMCDSLGQNSLDVAISHPVHKLVEWETESDDAYENCKSSFIGLLLEHDRDGSLYKSSRESCRSPNKRPLHKAIRHGKSWEDGVSALVKVDPNAVLKRDNETGLFPFMMAACHNKTDLTTTFELLRFAPEQIFVFSGTQTKRARKITHHTSIANFEGKKIQNLQPKYKKPCFESVGLK